MPLQIITNCCCCFFSSSILKSPVKGYKNWKQAEAREEKTNDLYIVCVQSMQCSAFIYRMHRNNNAMCVSSKTMSINKSDFSKTICQSTLSQFHWFIVWKLLAIFTFNSIFIQFSFYNALLLLYTLLWTLWKIDFK